MPPTLHRSHPFLLIYPIGTILFGVSISFALFYFRESIVGFPVELTSMLSLAFLTLVVLFVGFQLSSYYLTGLKIESHDITITRFRAPFEYSVEKIDNDHIASITSRKKTPLENILDMGQLEFATTDGRIILLSYMPSPLSLAEKCHQLSVSKEKV